jgi:hypothetical protein
MKTMVQSAPYPTALAALVTSLRYKPDWTFDLRECRRNDDVVGLTLLINVDTTDAYTGKPIHLVFPFAVPAEVYTNDGWRDWLRDRIRDAEWHELSEFFEVFGDRPYAPKHDPLTEGYRR